MNAGGSLLLDTTTLSLRALSGRLSVELSPLLLHAPDRAVRKQVSRQDGFLWEEGAGGHCADGVPNGSSGG